MDAVKALFQEIHALHQGKSSIPKTAAESLIDCLINSLFPVRTEVLGFEHRLESIQNELRMLLEKLDVPQPNRVCREFFATLPQIYGALQQDIAALFRYDPAATSEQEVVLSYPGFYAVAIYRLAHALHKQGVPILPRIWTEHAHSKTGVDIHPAAEIEAPFFIDHGTGIVIGATCVIGKNVRIYQGVTLGALSVKKELATVKRHPTIEDHVVIYANATVLGGNTTIGRDSIIGGNVWITDSVPPSSIVLHRSEIVIRSNLTTFEPFDWVI